MSEFIPYITLNGNAAEAIDFYCNALDGSVEFSQTFEDAPFDVPAEAQKNIMHATLQLGGKMLMISDTFGEPAVLGSSVSISINTEDEEEAKKMFSNLSDGATIILPFEEQFWGSLFGQLKDKFGIHWMVSCGSTKAE